MKLSIILLFILAATFSITAQPHPKISASTIIADLQALKEKNPRLTPRELADYGNQLLGQKGLTYVFDVCKSLKENGKRLPPQAGLFFQPHLIELKTVNGQTQTFEISVNYPIEGETGCFTQLAVSQINGTEMTVIADGKPFRLQRPKGFRLGKIILFQEVTKKIIRQWETPLPHYRVEFSTDEKKLYLDIYPLTSELTVEFSENGIFQFRVKEEAEKNFISFDQMQQKKLSNSLDSFANQDFTILYSLSFHTPPEEIYPLEIKPFSRRNPTFYEFDLPISQLRRKLLAAFNDMDLSESLAVSINYLSEGLIIIESIENASFATEIFTKPENKNDFLIHFDGTRVATSPIYFGGGQPLEYYAEFQLHLTELGNNRTKVSVITHKPRIINGSKCCSQIGHISNSVAVEPTTIEEYHILRFVGGILGAKNMPPLMFPEVIETQADKQEKLKIAQFVNQANQTFEKSKKTFTNKENSVNSPTLSYTMKGKEVETLVASYDDGFIFWKEAYYFKNKQLVYAAELRDVKFEGKIINVESHVYYLRNEKLFDYNINYHNKPRGNGWDHEGGILGDSQERLKQLNQRLSPKRKRGAKK